MLKFLNAIPLLIFGFLAVGVNAQNQNSQECKIELDLVNIDNDRVTVKIYPAGIDSDTVVYNMPKIVPGTYSISDFGRFVDDFAAHDAGGATMQVQRLDTNRWAIYNARKLSYITYKVNDTFDEKNSGIFEPGGTTIEEGKVVLLNLFGFAGYFDGQRDIPYKINVTRPENFYGATSMTRIDGKGNQDQFTAKNYFELHDCPILYSQPDTASMKLANARVMVANYSPASKVNGKEILNEIAAIFEASAIYLGGKLPVERYTVLVYLMGGNSFSGGFGALEHNTSTVFVMPEMSLKALGQTFKDVTAHEFFHIVTPLNIHSEQIHNYDFMEPQMSRHLWLYEGCTEYAAQHVQVKEGLVPLSTFLNSMRQKILSAARYDLSIPFTEMSLGALDKYENQYPNVYQQGALIGMALDLKLRHLSTGKYGIQELMHDMSSAYGPDKPFKDVELFSEIARISGYPDAETFLERHVAGNTPMPYDTLLGYAGISYSASLTEKSISGGNVGVGYNPKREAVVIVGTSGLDDFGKKMGFKEADELLTWNGTAVNMENVRSVFEEFKETANPGDMVVAEINRKNEKGVYKKMKLKAPAIEIERSRTHVMEPMSNPTSQQLIVRKGWINQ
jgi:predicted metalloprotease with PDZ domain